MNRFARFSWMTLAVIAFVIVWGTYVRATGSGAGCGSHWPTCNGEVLPRAPSTKTLIELTHRLTSAVSGLLVLIQVVWAFRAFPKGSQVRRATVASLVLMVTEGLIGAALVRLELVAHNQTPARAAVVAAHLVNTFLLVATVALSAWWGSGAAPSRLRGSGSAGVAALVALGGTLFLSASGAVTALGDTLFPSGTLREGIARDFEATAHFLERLRVFHPIIGLSVGAWVLFAGGFVTARKKGSAVRTLAMLAGALFGVQIVLGFVNLALLAPVSLQLVHLLVADFVWTSLVLLAAATLAVPASPGDPASPSAG